jgi:hypothetical protein
MLQGMNAAGLTDDEQQSAEDAANEVLTLVTQPSPDETKIRRSVAVLKGVLAKPRWPLD